MYPPHMTPPGVVPSADMGSVAQPVSLVDWFLTCYDATSRGGSSLSGGGGGGGGCGGAE